MTNKKKLHPLSNFEIEDYMKNIKYYRGCFCCDTLPKKINKNECGVVNMDLSTGPGNHWVGYLNNQYDNTVIYYDSYGVLPCPEVEKYLRTSGKLILYSSNDIQPLTDNKGKPTVTCGFYVVYVLKQLSLGHNYIDIIHTFSNNGSIENDKIIMKEFDYK